MNKYAKSAAIMDMYEMCMKAGMTEEANMYRLQFIASFK